MTATRPSRRTLLKGLGTCIALPALESLYPRAARAAGAKPVRLVYFYHPFGLAQLGSKNLPARHEALLAPIQPKMNIYSSLDMLVGKQTGEHAHVLTFLNNTRPPTLDSAWSIPPGGVFDVPRTFDQVIAQTKYGTWRDPMLALSVLTDPDYRASSGVAARHFTNLSWSGPVNGQPSQPAYVYTSPLELKNRLFGSASTAANDHRQQLQNQGRKAILDFVLDDVRAIRSKLGASDRNKLNEYLESVDKIDRDIASLPAADAGIDLCTYPDVADVAMQVATFKARYALFRDLMIKAIECDRSRVFMFQLMTATSAGITFLQDEADPNRRLNLGQPYGFHQMSHGGTDDFPSSDPSAYENFLRLKDYFFRLFVDVAQQLDQRTDPDGSTMLDNSLLVLGSEYAESGSHNRENIPIVTAGKAGGRMRTGLRLNLPDGRGVEGRSLSDFFITVFNAFDVPVTSFGQHNASGPQLFTEVLV